MKRLKKALALVLALAAIICMPVHASAAQESNSYGIDFSKTASVDIYKYDLTSAEKDGVWNSSYVSTGVRDEDGVESILGNTQIVNQLTGNGESYGYAIKGVEFSYIKVADIEPYNGASDNEFSTDLLYGFKSGTQTSKFLEAIGLSENDRYAAADKEVDGTVVFHFHSDTLVDALKNALTNNATSVKNALEIYVRENGGTVMPETDGYGHSAVSDLPLGLYLFVETRVPEMVTETTAPFLVSLPMTSTADNASWLYNVTLYPKNLTGILTLEGFDTSLAEGLMLMTPFNANSTDEKTASFVKKYQEQFGETPNQFAADAYDCVYAYKQALENAGATPDMSAEDLCDKMIEQFTSMTFDGLTGTSATWSTEGAVTKDPTVAVIKDGKYVNV